MMRLIEQAHEFDIRYRISDDRASPDGAAIVAEDIAEGVVYEKDGLKVTAFAVDHAHVKPAFGYRAFYRGRSVVLSGDTIEHHVTPEQAGAVFAMTKPKLAVYSHIGPPGATAQDLIEPTRKAYAGPLEVGEDLMVIQVGLHVLVSRPGGTSRWQGWPMR